MWKKTLTALALSAAVIAPAPAAEPVKERLLGAGAGAIAGAVIAGPAGFLVGIAAGDSLGNWYGEHEALSTDHARATAQVAELKTDLSQARHARTQLETERARLSAELARYAELRQSGGLGTELALDVLFRTNSATLEPVAADRVTALAEALSTHPELYVHLEGHADRRGTVEQNLDLSMRRAESVRQALVAAGLPPERIVLAPQGETQARAGTTDPEGLALDRRVTIGFGIEAPAALQAARIRL